MYEINKEYAETARTRYEENVISGRAAVDYMGTSTAIYKGVPVACLYLPKIFSKSMWERLNKASDTVCSILDKVIARYLEEPSYRKLFPFSKELERLILTEAGYPRLLPIARIDIFLNEKDGSFQFCEFNADGASAMNEDREINNALRHSDAYKKMSEKYTITSFEYFDSWVREFADIYNGYNKKVESPRIIITDFIEGAVANEFIEFKKAFIKAGYDADICDIRDLVFTDGALKTPDGKKVDAVYRRAVTRDIMEKINDVGAFIQAVESGAVCIIGHFRTQIIHTKAIFMILRLPETLQFLTEYEKAYVLEHIPETLPLAEGAFDMDDVLKNKEKWIIKPEDLYGSRGVYAGVDTESAAWEKAVSEAVGTGYMLQRYCPPYKSENLDFNTEERPDFAMYNNITGMFVYNGKLQGLYSRAGLEGTISSFTKGKTLASVLAE